MALCNNDGSGSTCTWDQSDFSNIPKSFVGGWYLGWTCFTPSRCGFAWSRRSSCLSFPRCMSMIDGYHTAADFTIVHGGDQYFQRRVNCRWLFHPFTCTILLTWRLSFEYLHVRRLQDLHQSKGYRKAIDQDFAYWSCYFCFSTSWFQYRAVSSRSSYDSYVARKLMIPNSYYVGISMGVSAKFHYIIV